MHFKCVLSQRKGSLLSHKDTDTGQFCKTLDCITNQLCIYISTISVHCLGEEDGNTLLHISSQRGFCAFSDSRGYADMESII